MTEAKTIPAARFLIDSGLLFEINRTILHPLGLAMEVIVEADGAGRIERLWDYRGDPEGMAYGSEAFIDGQAKFARFMEWFGKDRHKERMEAMGFLVQERPDQ